VANSLKTRRVPTRDTKKYKEKAKRFEGAIKIHGVGGKPPYFHIITVSTRIGLDFRVNGFVFYARVDGSEPLSGIFRHWQFS